jgi:hypothetical protein
VPGGVFGSWIFGRAGLHLAVDASLLEEFQPLKLLF